MKRTTNNAVCVLIQRNNQVLAVAKRDTFNDWGLPGGEVKNGETLEQAAKRELQKETGLNANALRQVYSGRESDTEVITFLAECKSEPQRGSAGPVKFVHWYELLRGRFQSYNEEVKNVVCTPEEHIKDALACYVTSVKRANSCNPSVFDQEYHVRELLARYTECRKPEIYIPNGPYDRYDKKYEQRDAYKAAKNVFPDVGHAGAMISVYVLWRYLSFRDPTITWASAVNAADRWVDDYKIRNYTTELSPRQRYEPHEQVLDWLREFGKNEYRPIRKSSETEREAQHKLDRWLFGDEPPRTAEDIARDEPYRDPTRLH